MARHSSAAAAVVVSDEFSLTARPDTKLKATTSQKTVSELDRVIHERIRLGVVSALAVNPALTFTDLKTLLVVHLTSVKRLGGPFDWEVELPRGTAGMYRSSIVKCGEIYTLWKEQLGRKHRSRLRLPVHEGTQPDRKHRRLRPERRHQHRPARRRSPARTARRQWRTDRDPRPAPG